MSGSHVTGNHDERKQNRRTALILVSIALVFFIGVIVRRWVFGE